MDMQSQIIVLVSTNVELYHGRANIFHIVAQNSVYGVKRMDAVLQNPLFQISFVKVLTLWSYV